jgi:hypothetical protein
MAMELLGSETGVSKADDLLRPSFGWLLRKMEADRFWALSKLERGL